MAELFLLVAALAAMAAADLPALLRRQRRRDLWAWGLLTALAVYVALSVLFEWPRFSPAEAARIYLFPVSRALGLK